MLNFFRNNKLSASFLVSIYAIPFLLSHYQNNTNEVQQVEDLPFLLNSIPKWITGSALIKETLLIVVLFVIAFWLNRIVNYNRLGKKNTYLTAISFFLVFFIFADFDIFSTSLIAALFCLGTLDQLFIAYEKKVSVTEVFNAAFLNSMAVLFYPAAIFLFLFLLVAWFILRTFNTKEFIILLAGFLIPLYLTATFYYINNQLMLWIVNDFYGKLGFIDFKFSFGLSFWIGLINFGIITIFTLLNFNNLKNKTTIREQKYLNVIFIFWVSSFLIWIFQKDFSGSAYLLTALPSGIFLSLNLQSIKNERLAEFLHFYILISVLFVQYYHFF